MFKQKFIDKLRKKYQKGGVSDDLISFAAKKAGIEGTKAGLTRAATATSGAGSTFMGGLSRLVAPAAIGYQLYDFYKRGQEGSGGRYGYEKNPNWVEGGEGPRHGDASSGAQFIPTGGKKHTSFWDNAKSNYKANATASQNKFSWGKKQTGGMYDQMQQYQKGGMALPGGQMQPIPGSDAVEFRGKTHNQGGIMLDPQTEVENGETMDQVNMAKKGGKRDYFFSSHLKKGGRSFADMHKDILRDGGNQEDINMLAKMQEVAAGRNPKQVAKLGGVVKYQTGGELQGLEKKYNEHEANKPTFDLEHPGKPPRLSSTANATVRKMHENKMLNYQAKLDKYNSAKAEYETALAEWEATESQLMDDIQVEEDLIEMAKKEAEEKVEKEKAESEALKSRLNEIKKKSKKLGINYTKFQNEDGKFSNTSLDAADKEIAAKEEEYNKLTAKADELDIKYDENTKLSDLQYEVDDALSPKKGGLEGGKDDLKGGKGVPETQGLDEEIAKKLGLDKIYLKDQKLKEQIMSEDWTLENWMAKLDQDLLKQAGITDPSDWNDKAKVIEYQKGLYDKYGYDSSGGKSKGVFSGKVGELILRSAPDAIENLDNNALDTVEVNEDKLTPTTETIITDDGDGEVIVPDDGGGDDGGGTIDLSSLEENLDITTPEITPTNITFDDEEEAPTEGYDRRKEEDLDAKGGIPWQAWAGMGAGLIPAAYSLFHKQPKAEQAGYTPGFTSPVVAERGVAPRLERYDYNQDISNVGAEVRGMNKYIETSGGGPANMINKMMAFSQGQDAKMKIRAAETRANIGVQNTEAQLEQQMTLDNMKRSQAASIFNAQMIRHERARKDQIDESNTARRQKRLDDMEFQKYAGMSALGQSLQTGFGDILDYKADMAKAAAIGSGAGNVYRDSLLIQQGYVPDAEGNWVKPAKFGGLRRLQNYKR